MIEVPGIIEHRSGPLGRPSQHANDILSRLECEHCTRLIMKLLWPKLRPLIEKEILRHERYHDRYH